jgi:serine/threonine-protein kinase
MVYVPSGDFLMGSDDNDVEDALQLCNEYSSKCKQSWFEIEQPAHSVTLDGFWLDQTEVTNAQFASFLNAQGNQMQGSANWLDVESERCLIEHTEEEFKPKSNYAAHPAVEVSWYGAAAYCAWVGGRLPTEAEWEYAARGSEGAIFPWGDSSNNTPLNFCDVNCSKDWKESKHDDGYERTAPVGTYSKGASWVDAMDMAGNAWEWVADWYGDYPARDQKNPTGPEKGEYRVLRGGSWLNNLSGVRGANRYKNSPELTKGYVGFRCVKHTLH